MSNRFFDVPPVLRPRDERPTQPPPPLETELQGYSPRAQSVLKPALMRWADRRES